MKVKGKLVFKQIIAWCTALALVVSFFPGYVLAAQEQAVSLEEAVQTAKAAFDIPKEFTKFSSGYNQYEERQAWELRWNTEKEPSGHLSVQVDSRTGDILNMSFWQSSQESGSRSKLPAISRDEAVRIATELVQSLQPKRIAKLKLEENNDELLQLTSWSPGTYRIKWVRQVQGVPFLQDGVTVNVDNQTGRIAGYNFNWTEGDFPDASKAISLEKARQAWEKAEMLQLQYFRPSLTKADEEREVKLVYRLTHPSRGVLDALTGKPLELDRGIMRDEGMGNMMKEMAMDGGTLTPEEIKEIEAAGKVINQAKAEAVVRKWVSLPEGFALQGVHLNQDEQRAVGARTWFFNWRYAGDVEDKGEGRWLDARVDALSGELLGFNWYKPYLRENVQQTERLNREEAQKKAEAFLQKIQPELFKHVKLNDLQTSEPPRPLTKEELPLSQHFEYQRLVNDIVFPANGLTVSVDTTTGAIESYSLNWQELQFPSAAGVLNSAQINAQFLKRQPLTLQYKQDVAPIQSGAKKEIRLVYCPVPKPGQQGEAMSDAKTGVALDWQGKPLTEQPLPYTFTDITGHWAEKEIALLGQAGILGEYDPNFYPETPITVVQYLRALLMIERGAMQVHTLSDQEVMEQAQQKGWLKEELQSTATIDRLQLARFGIRFLGLEQVAKIEGIYTVPYQDLQNITSSDQGYVALAWGLGILKGEQDSFQAEQIASRAQAAVTLIRMLKTDLK